MRHEDRPSFWEVRAVSRGKRYRDYTLRRRCRSGGDGEPDYDWPDEETAELVVQCLADLKPDAAEWLWKGRIPRRKVTLFEGESDIGKSTVTLDWARIVSTGSVWPVSIIDGRVLKSQRPAAGVLLVGVEDAMKDTVVPRLIANAETGGEFTQ
jgi:hypothetical protein